MMEVIWMKGIGMPDMCMIGICMISTVFILIGSLLNRLCSSISSILSWSRRHCWRCICRLLSRRRRSCSICGGLCWRGWCSNICRGLCWSRWCWNICRCLRWSRICCLSSSCTWIRGRLNSGIHRHTWRSSCLWRSSWWLCRYILSLIFCFFVL